MHGWVALRTVPVVLSEFLGERERVYCCAECKRESKRRHGKGEDDDDDGGGDGESGLLLRDVEAGEVV